MGSLFDASNYRMIGFAVAVQLARQITPNERFCSNQSPPVVPDKQGNYREIWKMRRRFSPPGADWRVIWRVWSVLGIADIREA